MMDPKKLIKLRVSACGLPRDNSADDRRFGRALLARPYRPSSDPLLSQGVPKELTREGPPSTREPGKAGTPSEEVETKRERLFGSLDVAAIVFVGR